MNFPRCLSAALLFFICLSARAQSRPGVDYFQGKWNLLVKGTPNGDGRMFVLLEKKDSTLTGSVQDSSGVEMSKITGLVLTDSSVNFDFRAQGYDVYLNLYKKDDDHISGKLMNMFDTDGERVRQKK